MSTPKRSVVGWLFAPAVAIMGRLTFARKFIVVGLLLSGPLAFVVYLQASSAGERVEFNRRERLGVAYLIPVSELLHQVQLHRLYSRTAPDGSAARQAQAAADAAATRVDALEGTTGALLGTRHEWAAIRAAWRERAHERVGSRIVEHLLKRVGNYSNLILDPDLDSYWLMDAVVVKLPSIAETATRASVASLGVQAGPREVALLRAGELVAQADRELAGIRELAAVDLATAFRETERRGRGLALEPRLRDELAAADAAVRRHAEHLRRQALGGQVAAAATVELAGEALRRLHALSAAIAPELDGLIRTRLAHYQARRTQGLVAAASAALVLIYLLVGIYLSVRSSVSALGADSPPPLAPSRDEMGQIAVAYSRARTEKSQLEEQLRAAERLATIGTLAAGTAHELNEPLGAILGFAELAEKTPDMPAGVLRDLQKISGAALHARDVIRKLLLFARQTPPQACALALREVVQEALDFLQPRFDLAAISLRRALDEVPPVLADASQLRQVVLNLAVNALQASRGGGHVEVRLHSQPGHAVLEVRDDGEGMSKEVCDQIFLPFFTTKDVGQGTGLGLSVVHGIVSSHGGRIDVQSAPGQGAIFTVTLPLASTPR
jgi:signal transduction histidine kinase